MANGSRFALSLLTAAGLAFTACAPAAAPEAAAPAAPTTNNWDQTVAAAKKEGKVVVVSHTDLYYREGIAAFQKAYPEIQVEHVAIRPSEFAPKLVTEQSNGLYGYDVWVSPTSNMVQVGVPAGAFQSMDPFLQTPEVKDGSNYRGGKLLWATTKGNFVLLDRGNVDNSVWVNRDVVSKAQFNSVEQLVDPAFKGKLAIRSLDAPHGGSLTLAGMVHTKGQAFIEKVMIEQQPQYIENARLLTQNLINGKVGIALGIDAPTLDQCMQAGGCKNLEQIRGMDYMLGNGGGVLKNAPHPNATAVFLNWWFGKAGREAYIEGIKKTTPQPWNAAHAIRKDVEPHEDAIKLQSMPDYDHLEKYSLQGMEQGNDEMDAVLNLFKKIQTGGR